MSEEKEKRNALEAFSNLSPDWLVGQFEFNGQASACF